MNNRCVAYEGLSLCRRPLQAAEADAAGLERQSDLSPSYNEIFKVKYERR
jgi:hypothetical protein